ncbi:chaoptin-like [Portunus trituberculatus]|uniref:chaoptin-like n=1 Tax=Portunus trituberculatus TaxID=210409 RepID=UPI001E1CE012|nr:chaoptin-like [Portunus trituberculatus]
MWEIKLGSMVLLITFLLMTWAYLSGATQVVQNTHLTKYPINERLTHYRPHVNDPRRPNRYDLPGDYPRCNFNAQCTCSNTGPDLGLVFCDNVELGRVPEELNNTKIHTLTLRSNNLRSLDEYAFYSTGMWRLEVRHNALLEIPEKAFHGLERSLWELDLQYNDLTRLPRDALRKLRKLKTLDLTGNFISDLTLEDFQGYETSLQTLVLAENSLTLIPEGIFRTLDNLRTLNLRGNNILTINAQAFQGVSSQLAHINLANNLLPNIPFKAISSVPSLQTLNLARNRISLTFDVLYTGSLSMDTLVLDFNQIETLPPYSFQNFGTVNRTSLRGNPLTHINDDAFKDAKIKELYLHDSDLWSISDNAFRGLESTLQTLDLSYNNLSSIPSQAIDNLASLRSLSISNNKLSLDPTEAFNGFRYTLQYLNLLGDNMGSIPMDKLKEMRNVRTLGLSTLPDTSLSKKDFKGFGPAVEKLYLMKNGITGVSANAFEHVPGVKILDLSNNRIGSFDNEAFANIGGGLEELRLSSGLSMSQLPPQPMQYLITLRELDLSNNALTKVSGECFRYMRNLHTLNMQDNKIDHLTRNHFQGNFHPYLESIQLSFNSISKIEPTTFHDYKNLKYLYLDDNQITTIERSGFSNLEKLEHLDLEGNNIRTLGYEAFQNMPKLRYLDLSFNEMDNLNLDAFDQVGTLSTLTIDASHNRIPFLKLNGSMWNSYASIKMIDFSHNNISWISRDYFESVRSSIIHLWFHHNNLRNISASVFFNFPQLQLLDFSHNIVNEIDHEAFRETRRLHYVNFRHNNLADLPPSLFENHNRLRHFDVSFNELRGIPDGLFKVAPLEIFRARNNRFSKFPDSSLERCADSIRVIDVAYNEIDSLTDAMMGRFDNLVSLDVSHNHIKTIEARSFRGTWHLLVLDISHNPVKDLQSYTFDGLQDSLMNLSVANTSLSAVPDFDLPRLMYLNVSHNIISFLPSITMANLTSIRVLDISYNELPVPSNSAWQMLPRLRELYMQKNPIRSLTNDSFSGLERLEVLDIRDFPLQGFEAGCLASMPSLQRLYMTTHPNIAKFNLAKALHNVPSLQQLNLEVDGTLGKELLKYKLPYRLTNITLMGPRMRQINPTALQELRARELQLTFYHTRMEEVPRDVFKNLGRVKYVSVAAVNNSMKKLGEPSTTGYPGTPNSVFLTDLRMHNNDWSCDCGIGWIEPWLKKWRQSVCVDRGHLEEYLRCQDTVQRLRETPCSNKKKSIMEALKTDLECSSTADASLLKPSSPVLVTILLSLLFFLRAP